MPNMISRNSSAVWTRLDGKVVLLDVEMARYYEANAVGGLIWELLEEPGTVDDIVERVVARFDVDPEQCRADVLKFLDVLGKSGLLAKTETVPEPAARSSME